jgi:hypothetical protein
MDSAYSVSMYYVYGGLECIVGPRFCTGGFLGEEALTMVICADCRRSCPLLIVHGLMCGDSFIFFLVGLLVACELGAPFRLAPPLFRLCFFEGSSIWLEILVRFLVGG